MNEKNYSENWGGARPGSGKKPTGRRKVNFYVDEAEVKFLRGELEKFRSGAKGLQDEKDAPISKMNSAALPLEKELRKASVRKSVPLALPERADCKKAVQRDRWERARHLKDVKKQPCFNHRAFVALREKYRYTAALQAVECRGDMLYIWFTPKGKEEEIFRSINRQSQVYDMSLQDKFEVFGYKDRGYVTPLQMDIE